MSVKVIINKTKLKTGHVSATNKQALNIVLQLLTEQIFYKRFNKTTHACPVIHEANTRSLGHHLINI